MRAAGLILLASSPFLAYVFLLPNEEAADVAPLAPKAAETGAPTPAPSAFSGFAVPGDLVLEPLNSETRFTTPAPARPRGAATAPAAPDTNGTPGTPGPPGEPGVPLPALTDVDDDSDNEPSNNRPPPPDCDAFSRANGIPGCSGTTEESPAENQEEEEA